MIFSCRGILRRITHTVKWYWLIFLPSFLKMILCTCWPWISYGGRGKLLFLWTGIFSAVSFHISERIIHQKIFSDIPNFLYVMCFSLVLCVSASPQAVSVGAGLKDQQVLGLWGQCQLFRHSVETLYSQLEKGGTQLVWDKVTGSNATPTTENVTNIFCG